MSIRYAAKNKPLNPLPVILQAGAAVLGGLLLFTFFVLIIVIGFDVLYGARIFPGVSVAGVDLSGLSSEEAAVRLSQQLTYPQTGKIVFENGDAIWVAAPQQLGLVFDAVGSAQTALDYGRSGNPLSRLFRQMKSWRSGANLPPQMIYDERAAYNYLGGIAAQVNLPTVEASLKIEGTQVYETAGQVGRQVDLEASLAPLEDQIRSISDGILPLVVVEKPPEVVDASQAAETVRQFLSAPLTLNLVDKSGENPGPWRIEPDQLAQMVKLSRVGSAGQVQYEVAIDEQAFNTYLSALSGDISRDPRNTRFMFNDDTRLLEVIEPAVIGRRLDVYATIQDIGKALQSGSHDVGLRVTTIDPEIGDSYTGAQLGITELVSAHTTYFRGSTEERLNNIEKAASNFHGLLVPPGTTFSMAEHMGNVSLDTGYEEAWIIFGGRTIKGVGGGVCQVSTTLFRTVFFGGYPIVERYPHAYRVGYYEQTVTGVDEDMAGLDATVFVPMVDFKFVNDTPYWLLMETYFNPTARSLTWKFYSTSDGREVEWETTGPRNVEEPPEPLYEENPELNQGVIKQVDWAAEGADVTVTRKVWRSGIVIIEDTFRTHYQPWRDVFQYGPGTELPGEGSKLKPKKKRFIYQGSGALPGSSW